MNQSTTDSDPSIDSELDKEIDELLKEVIDIHSDCIWSYDTEDHGGHSRYSCRDKFKSLIAREKQEAVEAAVNKAVLKISMDMDISDEEVTLPPPLAREAQKWRQGYKAGVNGLATELLANQPTLKDK